MAIIVKKNPLLVEDIDFGFDPSTQDRGGNQLNSSHLPYSSTQSVTEGINDRYTGTYVEANFAAMHGTEESLFNVANGVSGFNAVNFSQLDLKEDKTVVALKADKSNVLELDNNDTFSPLFDYNPSTKKYVDDSIFTAFQSGVSGSFTAQSGETITVTNGLITGII